MPPPDTKREDLLVVPVPKLEKAPWASAASDLYQSTKDLKEFTLLNEFAKKVKDSSDIDGIINNIAKLQKNYLKRFRRELKINYDQERKFIDSEVVIFDKAKNVLKSLLYCLTTWEEKHSNSFSSWINSVSKSIKYINRTIAILDLRVKATKIFNPPASAVPEGEEFQKAKEGLISDINKLSVDDIENKSVITDPTKYFSDIFEKLNKLSESSRSSEDESSVTDSSFESAPDDVASPQSDLNLSIKSDVNERIEVSPHLPSAKQEIIIPEIKSFKPFEKDGQKLDLQALSKQFSEFLDANLAYIIPDQQLQTKLEKIVDKDVEIAIYPKLEINSNDDNTVLASAFTYVGNLAAMLGKVNMSDWTIWTAISHPRIAGFVYNQQAGMFEIFNSDKEINTIGMLKLGMSIHAYLSYIIHEKLMTQERLGSIENTDMHLCYKMQKNIVSYFDGAMKEFVGNFPQIIKDAQQGKQNVFQLMDKITSIENIAQALERTLRQFPDIDYNEKSNTANELAGALSSSILRARDNKLLETCKQKINEFQNGVKKIESNIIDTTKAEELFSLYENACECINAMRHKTIDELITADKKANNVPLIQFIIDCNDYINELVGTIKKVYLDDTYERVLTKVQAQLLKASLADQTEKTLLHENSQESRKDAKINSGEENINTLIVGSNKLPQGSVKEREASSSEPSLSNNGKTPIQNPPTRSWWEEFKQFFIDLKNTICGWFCWGAEKDKIESSDLVNKTASNSICADQGKSYSAVARTQNNSESTTTNNKAPQQVPHNKDDCMWSIASYRASFFSIPPKMPEKAIDSQPAASPALRG